MPTLNGSHNQRGASIVELLVVITVMLIVMTAVFGLMKNSVVISTTTYEMTDAQENVRTAQEFINRDLIEAGDGMKGINNICVRSNFVTGYLSKNSFNDPCGSIAGMVSLPLVLSDNNVPANTVVSQTTPSVKVRSTPILTDRISMLSKETASTFTQVSVTGSPTGSRIALDGSSITLPAGAINNFNVGEIYFINSSAGATFATVTAKNTGTNVLSFAAGDTYGLNNPVNNGPLSIVAGYPNVTTGSLPATIQRMRIIHYFVDENGLLIRRVFGVPGAGFTDSVVAEHIVNIQYRYILDPASGLATAPITQFTTSQQQTDVRQVEVTAIGETTHLLANGTKQTISMTTTTSVRNLQFLQQPTAGAF